MTLQADVIILGAGPAGSTCALNLQEQGLRVLLLDKATFPRDKICGDALSGKVISVLRYSAPAAAEALHAFEATQGSWGIRFVAPGREVLDIPFRSTQTQAHPPGYVSRRIDFDHFLLQQLRPHPGFRLIEGFRAQHIEEIPGGIRVSDGRQICEAPLLVGADGAHSLAAKYLHPGGIDRAHHSAGVRAYYRGVTGFHPQAFIELHFIRELLPGYFWVFPLPGGAANVGLGMLSGDMEGQRINLRERLLKIVATHPDIAPRFRQAQLEGPVQGFGLPLGSQQRPLSGRRILLTGDAGALIDPFSGEGIGNAMISGRLAAQQIATCFETADYSDEALRRYDEAVYRKLGSELRLSYHMQRLVRYPWLFDFVARKANRNDALRTMFTMMFENLDMRKELSRPGFYWRLLFGGRAAAR
ncbi:MAG: geranylgeranyl reductase family protein [Bacteroidia bacterium]